MAVSDLVNELRQAVGDEGTYQSHVVPIGRINGSNVRFQANLFPLGDDAMLYLDDEIVATSAYDFDGDTGMLVYDTAPTLGQGHYLEGTIYRYKTKALHAAFAFAGIACYTLWEQSYPVVFSAGEVSFGAEPEGLDRRILLAQAAIFLLSAKHADLAVSAIKLADGTGSFDTSTRPTSVKELIVALQRSLTILIRDAGYTGVPIFSAGDYPGEYWGQSWFGERYGEIA